MNDLEENTLLAIRLTRMGAKKRPFYRIIVTEKNSKRDGRFLEIVGYYNPIAGAGQPDLVVKRERVAHWMSSGAQPTDTVRKLLARKSA